MNKRAFFTILFILVALLGRAQVNLDTTLMGSWSGKLDLGTASLSLVLHLEQADGRVKAMIDSPDQGARAFLNPWSS